jgi:hypothetical protein
VRRRTRRDLALLAAVVTVGAVGVGCAPDEDGQPTPDPTAETDPADDEAEAGDLRLVVAPACAEIGGEFTVTAQGLEPGSEYVVRFDPEPSATGEFDPSVFDVADDDGNLDIPAALPEDAGLETGRYDIELFTAEAVETDTGTPLIAAELEIAESCS